MEERRNEEKERKGKEGRNEQRRKEEWASCELIDFLLKLEINVESGSKLGGCKKERKILGLILTLVFPRPDLDLTLWVPNVWNSEMLLLITMWSGQELMLTETRVMGPQAKNTYSHQKLKSQERILT
jgi:hypothetical protein